MPNLNSLKIYLQSRGSVFTESQDAIELDLKIVGRSGNRHLFKLRISETHSNLLTVKEINSLLPSFCPNRHINSDGTFCLGLQADTENLSIEEWMDNLNEFLQAQIFSQKNGKWPIFCQQWSHGNAAIYQTKVEKLLLEVDLDCLGLEFNRLRLIEKKNDLFDEPYFHIYHNDKLLITGTEKKVHNKRLSCICDKYGRAKHITLGNCPKKCSNLLISILINEKNRMLEEEKFWKIFKNSKIQCCGTMHDCILKE